MAFDYPHEPRKRKAVATFFKRLFECFSYPLIDNKHISWAFRGLSIILIFSLAIYLYLDPSTPAQKQNFVKIVLQMIGGLIVFFGAYVAWQRVEVNRESQVTDRFIRANEQLGAVDQIGNPKIETRLGGIYALEQLARERKDYHWTIMEILTAYVRQNSPRRSNNEAGIPMNADIPAIIQVIGRREWKNEVPQENFIDLSETNLSFCNFSKGYFCNAWLFKTTLSKADLSKANFSNSILIGADLSGAELVLTDLSKANLVGAVLSRACLVGADLSGATLSGVDLSKTDLSGAWISNSPDLTQERLNQAYGDENTELPEHLERPAPWIDDSLASSKGSQDSGAT